MMTLHPVTSQRAANRRRVASRGTRASLPLRSRLFIGVFLIFFASSTIAAPQASRAFTLTPLAQFTSGVNLVEVYATVTDEHGSPVHDLTRTDFSVEEDGVPRPVEAFSAGDFPLSLALAVDRSFSVSRARLTQVVRAMQGLVGVLRPQDQVAIVAVGSTVDVRAPLSNDHRAAYDALGAIESWGTTPLFDATVEAIDVVQQASGRRALILVSDGSDRYSTSSGADVVRYAREHDVLVYPVVLQRAPPPIFVELAAVTGARSLAAADAGRLSPMLTTIADELRQQYLLGYVPRGDDRRGWRSITVRVNRPRLRVRARDGYVAR
jgi:VWFA-related protein